MIKKIKGSFILSIIFLISLIIFNQLPNLTKANAQPQPSSTPDWGNTTLKIVEHNFHQKKDGTVVDMVRTAAEQPTFTVEYKNKKTVSYWEFFDPADHEEILGEAGQGGSLYVEHINGLAKRSYSIFPLPGAPSFFLIIDNSSNKTKGIFEKVTINGCAQRESGPKEQCPWKYYKAYYWRGVIDFSFYRNGKFFLLSYYFREGKNKDSLLYKYINTVNEKQHSISELGGTIKCAKEGSELSAEEYTNCFFPEGESFRVSIKDNGNKAPTIYLPGRTNFDQNKYPGATRPNLTFTLKYVLRDQGAANNFYFIATSPSYPNLAIRLRNCEPRNYFVVTNKKESLFDDEKVIAGTGSILYSIAYVDLDSLQKNLINKVYKGGPYKNGECPEGSINWEDDGQLAKWGVERITRDEPVEGEGAEEEGSKCEQEAKCTPLGIFCRLGCQLYEAVGWLINKIIEWLNQISGMSLNIFGIERAYAAPLSEQLKSRQVATAWSFSLAATDVVIIVALLAVAFANILRLNIDNYAVKRALPGLAIGVILAHFSLLICRLLVDLSSSLSGYFLHIADQIISKTQATTYKDLTVPSSIGTGLAGLMGLPPAGAGGLMVGGIFSVIVASVLGMPFVGCAMIAAVIIFLITPATLMLLVAFLMYVRLYVVWILTILSPLGFITLGFPPASKYFKMWWDWFLKWVFLTPVVYFFIGLGAVVGSLTWTAPSDSQNQLSAIGHWLLGLVVLGMPLYVTQKMGGAIMATWGDWLKRVSGTGPGGYTRRLGEWGAKGMAVRSLIGPGGPTLAGRAYARVKNWFANRGMGREEAIAEALHRSRVPELRGIREDFLGGRPLNTSQALLIRRYQRDFEEEASRGNYYRMDVDTLLERLGPDTVRRQQRIMQFLNLELNERETKEVGAIIEGLRKNFRSARRGNEALRNLRYDFSHPFVLLGRGT